jgi:hypothetical protein
MAPQAVKADTPVAIRRPRGRTVTFVNQDSTVDISLSEERAVLAANWSTGTGPLASQGVKIPHGGTLYTWDNFPGLVWARAWQSDTTLVEVLS